VIEPKFKGVVLHRMEFYHDERGWLSELFRTDEVAPELTPQMGYISVTKSGVVRGPHEHTEQTDYFAFPGFSRFKIYLWDNRPGSETKGEKVEFEIPEEEPSILIIPPGVIHAYKNIGTVDGITVNCPNRLYRGEGKREPVDEIRYEDDPESPFRVD
jgi:dTDP-4-dehydrorhamnose 3,5-epimerase